jgi:hypothetical protein
VGDHLAQARRGQHLDAVDQRRLVGVRLRHDDPPVTGTGRLEHRREHAADATQRAVET